VPPLTAPYRFEALAWKTGLSRIAGVDEAGRGPLAGPVVAAAVVIAPDRRIRGLSDSKLLPAERREELFVLIHERAVAVGVGVVDHLTIDRINILEATRRAMGDALAALTLVPELVITDFVALRTLSCPQRNLVDGDARCASVAAASIVAKVTRDRYMRRAAERHPSWDFDTNVGYSTPEHRAAIAEHGVSPLHRLSFASIAYQQLALGG
jgi:ribonuclease HII